MNRLWLCEKPSQAKDIANVLGNCARKDGYIETAQGTVTWCFGHLLQMANPEDYDPALKQWSMDSLPIVPQHWKMLPRKDAAKQLKIIAGLLKQAGEVIISTDADREGEAIGRELIDHFKFKGGIRRLWLSALDEASIRRAIERIKPGAETAPLYDAALARARADWLTGMNLTRAATLALGGNSGVLSVGRVQTPTLALVVRRDLAIEAFKPRTFYELVAEVATDAGKLQMRHSRPSSPEDQRIYRQDAAEVLAAQAKIGPFSPLDVSTERKRQGPPKLFSLSELQKAANAKWGWSADATLKVAQSLYETHKATTYPRSDCNFLPEEQEADIPGILKNLAMLDELSAHASIEPQVRKTVFNSAKVTAHHAIIPTTAPANIGAMSEDERKAFFLIASHYLASLMPDYVYDRTTVAMNANGVDFKATGQITIDAGWRSLLSSTDDKEGDTQPLPPVRNGDTGDFTALKIDEKQTKAPARYTEGTLIADMAAIAKFVEDPAVKARLKETSGIGTEATRAAIIEVLKKRGYLAVKGKQIASTDAGRALIKALPDRLADPAETAAWEDRLEAVAQGREDFSRFVAEIGDQSKQTLSLIHSAGQTSKPIAGTGGGGRKQNPPTSKMLSYARDVAKRRRIKLPADAVKSFEACKNFLDRHAKG